MRYIPTEKDLAKKIKLVQIKVKGSYVAAIDERRKTKRNYSVEVMVPEGFNKSDIKRATPKVLMEHKDYPDFVFMRTFMHDGSAVKKTDKTITMRDLYSDRELERFKKFRAEVAKDKASEKKGRGDLDRGIPGDTSDIDPDTGLPPVINDGPEE
jgi:hypothetical protein